MVKVLIPVIVDPVESQDGEYFPLVLRSLNANVPNQLMVFNILFEYAIQV